MTLVAEPALVTPIESQERKSGVLVRLAAAVGGLAVLACAGVVTLGTVLIVLIGMAVVGGVQRKRGRPLTRTGHWVAACSTMAVVLLAVGGIFYAAVPRSALDAAKQSMDSSRTEAAKQPPPAWLERLSPGYRQIAQNAKPSPAAERIGTAFGVVFAITFFATFLGTLSWGAGMLLGLAAVGRWPGARGESLENLVAEVPRLSPSPGGASRS